MSDVVLDLLKGFYYGNSSFVDFVSSAFCSPAYCLASIFCIFFGLMLVLSVFKIFAMILRIFLDWRMYR